MSYQMVIALAILVLAFVIKMPIGIGMLISATSYLLAKGMDMSLVVEILSAKMFNNFILIAVPLFIFAANLMNSSKITDKIFGFADAFVGRWRGGLGHVNVVASLIFSGMSGSAVADASGLGIMEIDAMRKVGYDRGFSAAITAASSVIGPIFPPSIPLVIYGVIAGASIGNLFLAGMVPGILLAILLCLYVAYIAKRRNYPRGQRYSWSQFFPMVFSAFPALLTPIILLMGIYTGVMTATEAAAVAGLYALVIAIACYRTLSLRQMVSVLRDTIKATGQIGLVLSASYVFSYIISVEQLPQLAGNFILSFASTRVSFLLFINVVLLILGMFVDSAVLQLVLLPIIVPVARQLGIDMVHFGIIFTLNTMIGLCTPPYGMLLFIVTGISGEKLKVIFKEVTPMIFALVIVLLVVTYIPDVVLWVPKLLGR